MSFRILLLTNENEANVIQGIIEDELKIESRNEYIIQNSKSSSNIRAKGLVKEIENILLKFSEIKSVDLCLNLISLSTRLIDLKNETYQFLHSLGLSYFYSPSSEVEAWSIVLRASNLRSYCGTTSIADQIDPDYKISFFQNDESELALNQVAKLMYFPKLLHPYTGTIYNLGKDPNKVKTELEFIKESLIEAFIKNENR